MDQQREEEMLMHVAAGTDLPTAVAALPCDVDPPNEPHPTVLKPSGHSLIWAVLIFVSMLAVWWLIH
jgi:hypothetical protein